MARLSIGIVGLPNVGKSTLFRALTAVSVPAESYPFCTIDPNVGVVEVPDDRLRRLAEIAPSEAVTPAVVEFVDIAGLVEGASRGEGLGNRFLQNIREVDAVAHVLRCFDAGAVARVGRGDPVEDLEVVETELALADLEVVEGRIDRVERQAKSGEGDAARELELLERIRERLGRGQPARGEALAPHERKRLRGLNLLTLKPVMYVANVGEADLEGESGALRRLREAVAAYDPDAPVVPICAELEAGLSGLDPEEREDYLELAGLERRGLDRLVQAGYRTLGLVTFFTMNENELRAWTLPEGSTAPEAAGTVHTDFREGFIRAETISWEELVEAGSMKAAREDGQVRAEGKAYVVRDGDVLLFRTSA